MSAIASILLAFGINAWWEGRQDREEEHQALVALAKDFDTAADDISRTLGQIDSVSAATRAVLQWTGRDADSRRADSLSLFLPTITRLPAFRPPLGTLEALLGSGDLRLIRNDDLRAALASFPSRLARMQRTEDFGAETLFGGFMPYMNRSIPMRQFDGVGDGATRFETDVGVLLRSVEFENQLEARLRNVTILEGAAQNMRDFISTVRRMLEGELPR